MKQQKTIIIMSSSIKLSQYWRRIPFLILYYGIGRFLPSSYSIGGKFANKFRYFCCKHIFEYCGKNVNIEQMACFGSGFRIKIGAVDIQLERGNGKGQV